MNFLSHSQFATTKITIQTNPYFCLLSMTILNVGFQNFVNKKNIFQIHCITENIIKTTKFINFNRF